MPPARSARRQQRCICDYFFLLRFRLWVPPLFGVSGAALFFSGCALRRSVRGWLVGGGVTISGVRTPGLTSRRDAESVRSGLRSRLAGVTAGRRSAGVIFGCIFADGCACTCGDAAGVTAGRCAGVTRADAADGACRPADAVCCRAGETALPETGRIACGGASRAGETRLLYFRSLSPGSTNARVQLAPSVPLV